MKITNYIDGLTFTLEENDFRANWRDLLEWVKSLPRDDWSYDETGNLWWIRGSHKVAFGEKRREFIDQVLNPNQTDLFGGQEVVAT